MRLNRPIQTRFRYGSPHGLTSPHTANSQAHSSKGTPSQQPEVIELRLIVSKRFQVLFHSPPGVLFTFPSRYWSTIGHQGVFSLSGWSRQIHTGFHGPRATWDVAQRVRMFRLRGCYPLWPTLSKVFDYIAGFRNSSNDSAESSERSHNPDTQRQQAITLIGLACSPFARHYSGNRCCFLFLGVLRCFNSPGSLRLPYVFRHG